MDRTLSTVCHEIRNPLGTIGLHAELILKNPAMAAHSAEVISRTTRELEKVLTELMECTRSITEGNIAHTINDLVELMQPAFDEKRVNLTFKNTLNEPVLIKFDGIKIKRALLNLIKNALEASRHGDAVEISLEKKQGSVFVKISDQGAGIPKANREKVFEPFFTTKEHGTGIGLAEVKKIVEAHKGHLYIDPDKQGGTAFVIQFTGG